MTIPDYDPQTTIVTSENLINGNAVIEILPSLKHNYICESELVTNCDILGHPTDDCANGIFIEILGVVYLTINGTPTCFQFVDSFYTGNSITNPGVLGGKSAIELGLLN